MYIGIHTNICMYMSLFAAGMWGGGCVCVSIHIDRQVDRQADRHTLLFIALVADCLLIMLYLTICWLIYLFAYVLVFVFL